MLRVALLKEKRLDAGQENVCRSLPRDRQQRDAPVIAAISLRFFALVKEQDYASAPVTGDCIFLPDSMAAEPWGLGGTPPPPIL